MNKKEKELNAGELALLIVLAEKILDKREAKKRIKQMRRHGIREKVIKEFIYELSHNLIKAHGKYYHMLREEFRTELL